MSCKLGDGRRKKSAHHYGRNDGAVSGRSRTAEVISKSKEV